MSGAFEALLGVLRLKAAGALADVCAAVDAYFNGARLPDAVEGRAACEALASEGFSAAYRLECFAEARRHAGRADEIARGIPGYEVGRARTANNIALCEMELGNFIDARNLFGQALGLLANADDLLDLRSTILSNLAALGSMSGEVDAVRDDWSAALPPQQWWQRNNAALALLEATADQPQAATEALTTFQAILRDEPALDVQARATVLSNIASSQQQLGAIESAHATLTEACRLCDDHGYQGQVLAGLLYEHAELLANHQRLSEMGASTSVSLLQRAWGILRVIAPKARITLLVLRSLARFRLAEGDYTRARAILDRGMGLYDAMRDEVGTTELQHEGLFEVYRYLAELRLWVAVHEDDFDGALKTMEDAKARFWADQLARRGSRGRPVHTGEPDRSPVDVTGFNGVFLHFFVGPNAAFLLAQRNRHAQLVRIDVAESELETQVRRLRERMEVGLPYQTRALALSSLLFGKLRWPWTQHRFVAVFPDGPLWALPLQALPFPTTDAASMGELAATAMVPSIQTLRKLRARSRHPRPRHQLLVAHPGVGQAALRHVHEDVRRVRAAVANAGATIELSSALRSDGQPTVARVLAELERATHVHIAAHACASALGRDPYLRLFETAERDAMLTTSHIEQIQIDCEMVFLSACESSLGRASAGEGLASLARAFLFAGARCVIASSWPLRDGSLSRFCEKFYGLLLTEASVGRAFWRARAAYAAQVGRDETWTGLSIHGDADSDVDRYTMQYLSL